jgi:FG-GAP-like repeat
MTRACTEGPAASMVSGFNRYGVDMKATGAAWIVADDIDGDGRKDLVVSSFGAFKIDQDTFSVTLNPGRIDVYYQGKGVNCWAKEPLVTPNDGIYFPNQPVTGDVDGDGDLDIVVSAGFFPCQFDKIVKACGSIAWLENDKGKFTRHDVVPSGSDGLFYHRAVLVDFDGDKVLDLVTVGETNKSGEFRWWKGVASKDRFEKTPRIIGEGGGSLPSVIDVDGDGDLDVASAQYFTGGASFVWYERTADPSAMNPAGTFARHDINTDSGKSIMLDFVPNLYGDGVLRAVGTNHTNTTKMPPDPESMVAAFDIPKPATGLWPKTVLSTGIVSRPSMGFGVQAAPGVFGSGDLDGDGDIDLAVSGDGDQRTYWLEQTSAGKFVTHIIEPSLGQASGAIITDLDGDRRAEMVFTGYEDSAIFVYTRP